MSDVITGSTQLDATKQQLIASLVQKELAAQAKFLNTITDVSAYAVKGAKSISFPKAGSFTVANRTSGATNDAQALTFGVDTLNLTNNAYVKWITDSSDVYQSNIAVLEENIKRASTGHSRYVDTAIITCLEAAAFFSINTDTTAVTLANILTMRMKLLQKNADQNMLTLAVSPDQEMNMLQIDQFVNANYYGQSVIPNGVIGKLYGIPVLVSNALEAGQVLMYEKGAACIGFQKGAQYAEQADIDFGSTGVKCVVDQLFGVQALQVNQESAGAGKSPLCVKLTTA